MINGTPVAGSHKWVAGTLTIGQVSRLGRVKQVFRPGVLFLFFV